MPKISERLTIHSIREIPVIRKKRRVYSTEQAWKARETSKEAAESIAPTADTLRKQALEVLKSNPEGLTADTIARLMKVDKLSIRPRISELANQGLIKDSGLRGKNDSGKSSIIWVVNDI